MIWFGEGRWSWDDLYNMPIFLRRYWMNRIIKISKQQQEASKKRIQASKTPSRPFPTKPMR